MQHSHARQFGSVIAILLILSACGSVTTATKTTTVRTNVVATEPTLPATPGPDLPEPSSGNAVWAQMVNRTGSGPITLTLNLTPGRHTFDARISCKGPGSATLLNATGQALMSVVAKPANARCEPGWIYGTTWSGTSQANHTLKLAVSPAMKWALQIWVN